MWNLFKYMSMFFFARRILKIMGFLGFGLLGAGAFMGFPQVKDALAKPFQSSSHQAAAVSNQADTITVGFSPGNAERMVIDLVNEAKVSLDVGAYEFTNKGIAEAVRAAQNRGVKVRVVMDHERLNGKYNAGTFLANNHVPMHASNPRYKIMHQKLMLVDGVTTLTGSFNFTTAAARSNAENVMILRNLPDVTRIYEVEFQRLWDEGTPVGAKY